MQAKKELLLCCSLVIASLGLLLASDLKSPMTIPDPVKCQIPSKCCKENTVPYQNSTPWKHLTEGVLHISV